MSEIATISLRSFTAKAKAIEEPIFVGKDILELLAGAMYSDPLTIYREYVQNAADAIDVARAQGDLATNEGEVVITIDATERRITIRDNGASLPASVFTRTLTSIGASGKRGKLLRGFRGVGRLSGLGYCQELVFRGRTAGASKVMELRWDGRQLRSLLRDPGFNGDLGSLIKAIAQITEVDGGGYPERFFEVQLNKVARLRSDVLLDADQVRHYLGQVAPVPFAPTFSLAQPIAQMLRERGVSEPITIRLEGDAQPVYHRAQDELQFSQSMRDKVTGFEALELRGLDGDVAAVGWVLDHGYLGALPRREGLGGLRLRAGNIQVGAADLVAALFTEPRLAGWAIGDLHVISPKIVPNGRRDDFEPSLHYAHLQDEMALIGKTLTHVVRTQSDYRNKIRRIRSELAVAKEWLDRLAEEKHGHDVRQQVIAIAVARLDQAVKMAEKLPQGHPEREGADAQIEQLRRRAAKAEKTGKPAEKPLHKSARIALEIILKNASSPHAALSMSKKLINALTPG